MKARALGTLLSMLVAVGVSGLLGAASTARAEPEPERERRLVETYRQMLSSEPGQEYAFRRLLETAHAVGGLSGLIALYNADLAKDPKDYAGWLVLGSLHRTADDPDAARVSLAKAAALKPDKAEPHLVLAALERDRRAWDAALAAYDKAAALARDKDTKQETLHAAAETAVEAKDVAKAQAYFDKLIQTEPGNLFLRMQAASTLARLDQPAVALARWKDVEAKASGQLTHLVVIWREMAELQAQMGLLPDAEATWRKGLEKLPNGHYERRSFLEGLVSVYRRQDRLRALIGELMQEAQRDVEVTLMLARLHEELAEDERALAYYRDAQKKKPSDEEPRMAALRILERIGTQEEVLAAWVDLVRAFPREPRYQLRLAELYFQRGKPKEGGELLKRMSRENPLDPGLHALVVDLWLRVGDKTTRPEVEAEFKILLRLEPDEPSHVVSFGEFYWSQEDKPKALSIWKKLLQMGKKKGEGSFLYAEALADHDLRDDALAMMREAIAADPNNDRYQRGLAALLEKMNRPAEALTAWTRLLERGDTPAPGELRRASAMTREARERVIELWQKEGRLDREIASLGQRFAATPPDLAAGRFLAVALTRTGRLTEARAALERLDGLVVDDPETLLGLEQIYTRQSEPRLAVSVLERLATALPRAATEYLHRAAELALSIGDEGAARRATGRILELAPADATARTKVGEIQQRMGLRAEAAESWRQALVLEPRNIPVRFKLASLYREMGLAVREEQALAEIVREASDGTDVLRAGRRLLQLGLANGRLEAIEALLRPLIDAGPNQSAGRDARGNGHALRLVVDLYAHLAQSIRYANDAPEVRERRLVELGERGLRPLVAAIDDNDIAVRARALDALELTHPAGATAALARLAATPESMAQVEAISTLGRIGSSGSVAVLARLVSSTTVTVQTRELAIWGLGLSASPEAAAALTARARTGTPRDRVLIAMALGRGRHRDGGALAIELANDRSPDVRELGTWAVARLAQPESVTFLADRLATAATLREGALAAWGLARLDTPQARAALVTSLWRSQLVGSTEAIWTALVGAPDTGANEEGLSAAYDALVLRERGSIGAVRLSPESMEGGTDLSRLDALVGTAQREGPLVERLREVIASDAPEGRARLAENVVRGDLTFVTDLAMSDRPRARALTLGALARVRDLLLDRIERDLEPRGTPRKSSPDLVFEPFALSRWLSIFARWHEQDPAALREAWSRVRRIAIKVVFAAAVEPTRPDDPLPPLRGALELIAASPFDSDDAEARALSTRLASTLIALSRGAAPDLRAAIARAWVAVGGRDRTTTRDLADLLEDPATIVRLATLDAIAERRLALGDEDAVALLYALARDPLPEVGVAAVRALIAQPIEVSARARERLAAEPAPHIQRALRDAIR